MENRRLYEADDVRGEFRRVRGLIEQHCFGDMEESHRAKLVGELSSILAAFNTYESDRVFHPDHYPDEGELKKGMVAVRMRDDYLLNIATHGNMGTGELSDFMKMWAQRECVRAGLGERFLAMQGEKLLQVKAQLKNLLGDDAVAFIDNGIQEAKEALQHSSFFGLDKAAAEKAEAAVLEAKLKEEEEKEH